MEITVETHEENGCYWSEVTELPGCFASGWTLSELRASLEEGLRLYLDDPAAELTLGELRVGSVRLIVNAAPR